MLKNVLVVAALAVSSLLSAQDFSVGGIYSASTSNLDASYGVEIGYKSFGVMFQTGAFLDEIDINRSVETLMNGGSIITGGTYNRYILFIKGFFTEKEIVAFRLGAGFDQQEVIGARSEYVFTKDEYSTKILFGLEFNVPETNVYLSASALGTVEDPDKFSTIFGLGYRF